MGSTFTLVWFVLVQILLYSSANSCRRSSPHLWWLTFGVLSVMYIMILEVVVVAILVFVVGPILFVGPNNPRIWMRLTLHSYFGASSYYVSGGILPKTHTTSHPISGKSRGLSSINFLWCSTFPHHPTSHRSQSHSHQNYIHTHRSPQPHGAAYASYRFDGEPHPAVIQARVVQARRRRTLIDLPLGKITGKRVNTHLYSWTVTARRARFACSTSKNRSGWAQVPKIRMTQEQHRHRQMGRRARRLVSQEPSRSPRVMSPSRRLSHPRRAVTLPYGCKTLAREHSRCGC
jgi:hypothetical protein